jgi:hypothetical protein
MLKLYYDFGNKPTKLKQISDNHSYTSDFSKLKYWGLIIRNNHEQYQVTEKGEAFLNLSIPVPKILWVFNDKVQDFPSGKKPEPIFAYEVRNIGFDKDQFLRMSMPADDYKHPDFFLAENGAKV